MDGIAAKRHVIALDNRGIGASSGTPPNSMEQMADDATTFIKAMGLKQVDLLGFSMGGISDVVSRADGVLAAKG